MSEFEFLSTESVTAYYDPTVLLGLVEYRGELSAEVTATVYKWIFQIVEKIPLEQGRGSIYDFRQVTHFKRDNTTAAFRQSTALHTRVDTSNHPVALIVGNFIQEHAVRIAMRISPQEERKRIVHSQQEALAFINSWNRKKGRMFDLDIRQLNQWPQQPPAPAAR